MRKPCFMAFHPVDVARNGVDFTIMRKATEWLCQLPCGEGVGGIALVINSKAADKAFIQQIWIKLCQMLSKEHALIDNRPA